MHYLFKLIKPWCCVCPVIYGGQRGEVLPEGVQQGWQKGTSTSEVLFILSSILLLLKRGKSCLPSAAWKNQKRWAGEAWLWSLRKVIHLCSASVLHPGPSVSRTRGEVTFPVPGKGLFVNAPRGLNLAWLTGWNLGGGLLPAAEGTHPEVWESPSLRGQARRHRNTSSLSQGPSARVQLPAFFSRGRPQHHHSWPGLRVPRPPDEGGCLFPHYEENLGAILPSWHLGRQFSHLSDP